jgi:hypothetical protein
LILWLIGLGGLIVCGLSWYAWSLTSQLKTLENKRCSTQQDAMIGVRVLIDSYLDNQVDRSECLLRMRVLLDAHCTNWLTDLELHRFDEISHTILTMPFGGARQHIDVLTRRKHDSARRQLLQIHEAELKSEMQRLKEWVNR